MSDPNCGVERADSSPFAPPSSPPSDAASAAGPVVSVSTGWRRFLFAAKAIEIRLRFIGVLVVVGVVAGYWDTIRNYVDHWTRPASAQVVLDDGMEFFCPMDPGVIRGSLDPDGSVPKCPICGMLLSKRKKGERVKLPDGILSRVQLSPQRVQLAGIQTSEIELRPLSHQVRTVGNVAFDESRLSRVVTRVGGYVEKLHVNKSFTEVRQGEPLAELYSPDLYAAEQELLLVERSGNAELTAAGREKLRLLGMDGRDVDEMLRSGKASYRQVLRAPHTGHVIRKEVVEGDRVEPGMMLFEVADLSVAWIEAEVYEKDIAAMRSGTPIAATVEALPDRTFSGKVALVHPHVEAATRTNRVRFEVDNPGHALRPGMYATVRLETPIVEMEPFRTRLAELASGPQGDDDAALVAFQKLCPVQGSRLGSMGKPIRATAAGQSVMLCCKGCQDDLAKRPQYYLSRLKTLTADSVLAVPQQAVIDTGERKIVYVQRHPDTFEGVEVRLGPRSGEYYAVAEGLLAGDRVASAGAFLVDAETRLNPAAASAYFGATGGPQPGSSTGNATGSSPGAAVSAVDGESNIKQGTNTATRPSAAADRAGAKTASAKKIRDNLAKLSDADRKAALAQGVCPVTHKQLGSMGVPVKVTIKNRTVFLCCDGCEAQATGDPAATLREIDRKRLPK